MYIVIFHWKGWFPVKMKTFVADPIEFDENNTVDDLDCLV